MTQKATGYSGSGNVVGHVSQQIQDGLNSMQEQIAKSQETLNKSREDSGKK